MTLIDKVVAAVTPPESENARHEAREKARAAATPGDWLSLVLDHHEQIEAAFAAVPQARTPAERTAAQQRLALLLTGHSLAEEAVLYPALADAGEKGHAATAYTQQSAAKLQMGLLEKLDPSSQDYLEKLEHIRGAVAHHVYAEENNWFLDIKNQVSSAEQQRLTARYREEFSRYAGAENQQATARRQSPEVQRTSAG